MLTIKRIVVGEYHQVTEIEFGDKADSNEVAKFCHKYGIARGTFKSESFEEKSIDMTTVWGGGGMNLTPLTNINSQPINAIGKPIEGLGKL